MRSLRQIFNEDSLIRSCSAEMKPRSAGIIKTIAKYSGTGRTLLKQARKDGYRLIMAFGDGWSGQVDADRKLIVLNACESDDRLIETLAHECRHVQQYSRGVDYGCGMYNIKDAVRLHRCKEADAEAAAAAVCHEIRVSSGNEAPWKAFATGRPFVARGLEKEALIQKASVVTPQMLRAAFDGWYADERVVRAYEENYIEKGILTECFTRKERIKDFFHKKTTSQKIVSMVCTDNKGGCYWSANPFVLNESHRLMVSKATVRRAEKVLTGIEKTTGIKQDHSYRDLPLRFVTTLQ